MHELAHGCDLLEAAEAAGAGTIFTALRQARLRALCLLRGVVEDEFEPALCGSSTDVGATVAASI